MASRIAQRTTYNFETIDSMRKCHLLRRVYNDKMYRKKNLVPLASPMDQKTVNNFETISSLKKF